MSKKSKKSGAKSNKKLSKKIRKEQEHLTAQAPALSFARSIGISDSVQVGKIDSLLATLSNTETYRDPAHSSFVLNQLQKELDGAQYLGKDYMGGGAGPWSMLGVPDIFGFKGFSSQFNNVFGGSVYSVFAWISENYSYMVDCLQILEREILADGYRLEGGTKEDQARAKRICTQLNMKRLRCDIAKQFKTYGGVWFEPIRNGMKGIKNVKPLLPAYIRPIPTFDGQNIKQWQVQKGACYQLYGRDDLLHAVYKKSAKNYDIGVPPLGAVLVDIESDVAASDFGCAMMQKGGLFGVAVLLDGQNQSRGKGPSAYAQYLQAALQANHSGNRSAYETVVFENAKDVKIMNKLTDMVQPFAHAGDTSGKRTAHVMGIPHEMLGIITNANQQYHPSSLLDSSMKQLDKTIAELLDAVDTFINKRLFPLLGVKNVRIVASPRYNSVTATAAKALLDYSSIQNFMSVNEGRVNYAGLPPIEGGDVALTKLVLDSGTKGGEGGAGAKPSQPVPLNPMPPMLQDIEQDSDEGSSEGIPG